MTGDPVRQRLQTLLRENDLTMARASIAIGRNKTYLQQFLHRGMPKVLGFRDSEALATLLGCDPAELRHQSVPRRKPQSRTRSYPPPGVPLAAIPEMAVNASAGAGAFNEEPPAEKARWYLPEAVVRHEAGAEPERLRILRVQGNSMAPEMRAGDRVFVDTTKRTPATGELFVVWDGNGLVVKRIETVHDTDPPRLRLLSDNPSYAPYTCLASEAHIVGKVLWTLRRV